MSLEQQISILKLFLEDVLYFSSNNNGEQKTRKHLKILLIPNFWQPEKLILIILMPIILC